MAGVPDTNTFSLQDVVDIIPGVQTSLQDCFDDALADLFDPAYEGSKDALLNFRNYGNSSQIYYEPITAASRSLYHNDASWSTVRGDTDATSVDDVYDFEIWVEDTGSTYTIHRAFMRFDLTSIPVTATCEEAGIGLDLAAESADLYDGSNYEAIGIVSTHGASIGTADWDALTLGSNYLFSTFVEVDTASPDYEDFMFAIRSTNSTELGRVEDAFGGYLEVAIINKHYDNDNNQPFDKRGMTVFNSGEAIGGVIPPALRLVITI